MIKLCYSFKDFIFAIKNHVNEHGDHLYAESYYLCECSKTKTSFKWMDVHIYNQYNNIYDIICQKYVYNNYEQQQPVNKWLHDCIDDEDLNKLFKLKAFE